MPTTTNKKVPKLRFSKYLNSAPSLTKTKFVEIFNFSNGKNIKQNEASPHFRTPCVRYGELYHMYGEVIKEIQNRTNIPNEDLIFSQGTEILLPSAGEDPRDIGAASALVLENVAIGRTINILRPKKPNLYDPVYVSYYINSVLRKKISTLARGSSISNVYNSDLRKLTILLPTIREQRDVAEFLVKLDELIELLEKKLELSKKYKKGLMQKLFPRDNQTNPELRFKKPDGSQFSDWTYTELGKISSSFSGGTPTSTNTSFYNGSIPFIGSGDIGSERISTTITELALKNSSSKLIEQGDLLYALYGATSGEVAIAKISGAINQAVLCIRCQQDTYYLYQWLKFSKQRITSTYLQGGQGNLSGAIIKQLALPLPCTDEQEKIADFLSSIDEKIDEQERKLGQAKIFKKALLQQMFI